MRLFNHRLILLLALSLGLTQAGQAAPDRDRDNGSSAPVTANSSGGGPTPGNCILGRAEKDLDVNNVLARVFNTGSLFFGNSSEAAYIVPQASGNSPIFASGIWIGGMVDGEIRVAGSRYTRFEFWPGPLNPDGTLPDRDDCSQFDRIYKVGRQDIQNFESGAGATADLAQWPAELGAPVLAAPDNGADDDGDGLVDEGTDGLDNDGDGFLDERDEQERVVASARGVDLDALDLNSPAARDAARAILYDLAAGDRPEIIGDQALWWVMNDVGNTHEETGSNPLGVEVQVQMFSFARADALGETTFYRYRVINKSGADIMDTYLSVFSDPDLGDAADDYIGSDSTLSLGFVYNGEPDDNVYGVPPAAGYDFFQGPIVDLDGDGVRSDTLGLTRYTYFCNGCAQAATSDPRTKEEYYNHMLGLWKDGTPFTAAGDGYQTNGEPTKFVFPGDPVTQECWSMINPCVGSPIAPNDQRLIVHTGPFTLEPGVPQDIVFGVVFAQGSGYLSSVAALRAADRLAQAAYDADFELPLPPPAPPLCNANSPNEELQPGSGKCLEAVEEDGRVTLIWGYPTTSDNYLGGFEQTNRLLVGSGLDDITYNFEGFNIYRYPTSGFPEEQRELVATFDIDNGVTTVIDERFDPDVGGLVPFVSARGSDTGLQYYFELEGLTNYTDYYYGISAYSYNENSVPKVIESTPTKITVRPSRVTAIQGGSFTQVEVGTFVLSERVAGLGSGNFAVRVVDPLRVTGAQYRVVFYDFEVEEDSTVTTYNILRDGQVILNGQQVYEDTGELLGLDSDAIIVDGLEFFSRTGVEEDLDENPDFSGNDFDPGTGAGTEAGGIIELAYPGTDTCPDPSNESDFGCANYDGLGNTVWHDGNVNNDYYLTANGGGGTIDRSNRFVEAAAPYDYELRFTEACATDGCYGTSFGGASSSSITVVQVPFEAWNIGNPIDPSDDIRMIPLISSPTAPNWADNFSGEDEWVSSPCATDGNPGCPITDAINLMMPDRPNGYDLFEQAAIASGGAGATYVDTDDTVTPLDESSLFVGDFDPFTGTDCSNEGRYLSWCYRNDQLTGQYGANAGVAFVVPIVFVSVADLAGDGTTPPVGTTIRFQTVRPVISAGQEFILDTADIAFVSEDPTTAESALDLIGIVPNPYMGASAYETSNLDRVVRFINMPERATIRVYTVAGTLIKTLEKDGPSRALDWDLTTSGNLPVASGMYLVHVEVPGVGERVLKFGVVNRQNQISVF